MRTFGTWAEVGGLFNALLVGPGPVGLVPTTRLEFSEGRDFIGVAVFEAATFLTASRFPFPRDRGFGRTFFFDFTAADRFGLTVLGHRTAFVDLEARVLPAGVVLPLRAAGLALFFAAPVLVARTDAVFLRLVAAFRFAIADYPEPARN